MLLKELKKNISENKLRGLYLFYGDEEYLKEFHIKDIIKSYINPDMSVLNLLKIDGKLEISLLSEFINTPPLFSDTKLLIVKNSEIFTTLNKINNGINIDNLKINLMNLPKYIIVIFQEKSLDKRLIISKFMLKEGNLVEFRAQNEEILKRWVNKIFNNSNKKISIKEIEYFLSICDNNMNNILEESRKLIAYIGNREIVEKDDLDIICTKTLKSRIFDLIDAISCKDPKTVQKMLEEVLILGEPVQKIIVLIERQLRIIYGYIILKQKKIKDKEIIKKLGIKSFLINKISNQSKVYTESRIKEIINLCHEVDVKSKSGLLKAEIALNLIIASMISK